MLSIEKIRNVLHGTPVAMTTDEQSVVTMACHLTALQICDMETLEERRAAVSSLPGNLAEAIKTEVAQEYARRRSSETE